MKTKLKISVTLAISLLNISGICGLSGSGVGGVPSPLDTGDSQRQAAEQEQIYQQQAYQTNNQISLLVPASIAGDT